MNIDQLTKGLAEISYTPVTKFKRKDSAWGIEYTIPDLPFLDIFMAKLPHAALGKEGQKACIYIHAELLFFGFVQLDEDTFFVLGPVIELPVDNITVHRILKTFDMPLCLTDQFIAYYEGTPHYSIYKFAQILTFLNNNIAENPPISAGDILPEEYRRAPVSQPNEEISPANNELTLQSSLKNDKYERELFSLVYTGQYEKMKAFIKKTNYTGDSGVLARSAMIQNKYLVITSITLASRAAVQGGLNYNTAMKQADFFYRKVDEARTFNELFDTHKQMLLVFTQLVAERKLGKPTPPLFLSKIQQYVEMHITERITTEDIASSLKVNRSYLSTQFKKECGIDLGEYVNRLKIDEAKRLMLTTDLPLITIANNLAFSSQSHFVTVFKRLEGITPTEFARRVTSNEI